MAIPRTVAEVVRQHVTFELECIDRMYLNLYVPILQSEAGVAYWMHTHLGCRMPSTVVVAPKTEAFVKNIERFVTTNHIDLVRFKKGERKDEVTQEYLAGFTGNEGVLYVGKAQERVSVIRTQRRRNPNTGQSYPWLYKSTAMVNQYYFYCVDDEFGPFFLKFCSYFPYNAKLCLNGHEYLKRQLTKEGIDFEALDNGLVSCADPERAQQIAEQLSPAHIDALARKWFAKLPHPFPAADRRAGARYDISILQAEFALTQIVDRPLSGRVFFEDVIRENLDLGRPDRVQLLFNRRVTRRTPGQFRTRVITRGVVPTLHINYKSSDIKQYFKSVPQASAGGLRTETTVNNTRDFGIGRRLQNLPALRDIGFQANRRLLDVQTISHDCSIGEDAFRALQRPVEVGTQRTSALRFGDERVQALFAALVGFVFLPRGFSNRDLREHVAPLLGKAPSNMTPGQMTYDLRRMRLHGLIERIPKTHRYRPTELGFRVALFYYRVHARILRPGLSQLLPNAPPAPTNAPRVFVDLHKRLDAASKAVDRYCDEVDLAA